MDKEQLAENIRTGRARLNLTRVQFARKAKITTNTLRTLESGAHSRLPDTETLQKVARVLKTTTEGLLTGKVTSVQEGDPLLAGLSREDLMIARQFHDATTALRVHVTSVLRIGSSHDEKGVELITRVMRLGKDARDEAEKLIGSLEQTERAADVGKTATERK